MFEKIISKVNKWVSETYFVKNNTIYDNGEYWVFKSPTDCDFIIFKRTKEGSVEVKKVKQRGCLGEKLAIREVELLSNHKTNKN